MGNLPRRRDDGKAPVAPELSSGTVGDRLVAEYVRRTLGGVGLRSTAARRAFLLRRALPRRPAAQTFKDAL